MGLDSYAIHMDHKECPYCGKRSDPLARHECPKAPAVVSQEAPSRDAFDEAVGPPTGDCASCGHPAYAGQTLCHCPAGGPIQPRDEEAPSTKAPAPVDEAAAFAAWRKRVGYESSPTVAAWKAWEARAALQAPASGREGGDGSGPSAPAGLREPSAPEPDPDDFPWEPHARALRDWMEKTGTEAVYLGPRWKAEFLELREPEEPACGAGSLPVASEEVSRLPGGHNPATEDAEVLALCEKWGFGAVMSSASRQWRQRDPVGAKSVGECYGMLEPGKKLGNGVARAADGSLVYYCICEVHNGDNAECPIHSKPPAPEARSAPSPLGEGPSSSSPSLPPALDEQDALERLRDIRYHLANIPPVLRNQATEEALGKVNGHIGDLVRRPLPAPGHVWRSGYPTDGYPQGYYLEIDEAGNCIGQVGRETATLAPAAAPSHPESDGRAG